MLWLNAWLLFALIPLYMLYKKDAKSSKLLYLALAFMIIALARPVLKDQYKQETLSVHDYIIALDVSYSMQANDLKPSRYALAKEAIKKMIQSHEKDRFTLFVFSANALMISPPTEDSTLSILALDALNPQYILTKSTHLKNLFKTIGRLNLKEKNLILFSDGGEEHDVAALASLAKEQHITPYIVATATQRGAALKKDGHYIKRPNGSIVISKINPMLKDLAHATGGKYYQLTHHSSLEGLIEDIKSAQSLKHSVKVQSYKELFYLPLALAWILFFIATTKFSKLFAFMILLLFIYPHNIRASLLDFVYLNHGYTAYKKGAYKEAALAFKQITPSPQSWYNVATAYAKAGACKDALKFYAHIQTTQSRLKANIYYNMGYCAAKLKHYKKAQEYFMYALALNKEDSDALYNLNLLRRLKLKKPKDISRLLPTNKREKQAQKRQGETKKSSASTSSNKQQSAQVGAGTSAEAQKGKEQLQFKKAQAAEKKHYRFSYRAYEKINKGYTDEKEPW